MSALQLTLVLLVYTTLATSGLVLLKRGLPSDVSLFPLSAGSASQFLQRSLNLKLIVGFVFYAASFALSLVVMAALPINRGYPLLIAVSYVGAIVAGFVVLGENVSPASVAGLALIGAGMFLVGTPRN